MKKELIGKTKEERKLVFDSLLFFAVFIALAVFTFTKCNTAYNHAISQKQITTSVDGQGVK